jgi:hypothetical protein
VSKNIYLDNRSNALEVVRSFYNAINLKEYVRAYSYWGVPGEANPSGVQPYPDFEKGYANTASVELSAGPVLSAGAAAGSAYYRVPVLLKATNTGGSAQTFAGCYLVRQSNPANFGAPPFHPMRFEKASIKPVNGNGEVNQAIAEGCETNSSGTNSVVTFPPTGNPPAIDASRFVDDRSDPAQVLRSFYNAINRKEYVRAYSYWKDSAVSGGQVQPYPQFEQGYQTTASVQLAVGKFTGDPGAGQIYYSVPVALVSHLIGDRVQTFVGCYTLHQSRPAIFGAPPFVPLGITKGDFKEVPANTDTNALLAQATTMCK